MKRLTYILVIVTLVAFTLLASSNRAWLAVKSNTTGNVDVL